MVVSRTLAAAEKLEFTRESALGLWRDSSLSQEEIAFRLGVSSSKLREWARRWALPAREPKCINYRTRLVTRERLEPLWLSPEVNVSEIARRFGVGPTTIRAYAEKYGLPPRGPIPNAGKPGVAVSFTKEQLAELWPENTVSEIAGRLNCTEKTVRKWARQWGLPLKWLPVDPTPEEIRERAAKIRESWPAWRLAGG